MSSLTELREKVERASGHDDAINVSIYARLHESYPIAEEIASRRIIPDYTGSIDAALALVERKLPDAWWPINSGTKAHRDQGGYAYSCRIGAKDWQDFEGRATTAPLAILEALLRALESQEQAGG